MSTSKIATTYTQVRAEAERPLDERRKLVQGRAGRVVPRKHHLDSHEIDQLAAAHRDGEKFPNPHNRGNYFYLVETLKALGLNKRHSLPVFKAKLRELMEDKDTIQVDGETRTNAWQRFFRKDAKNAETGRDADGRILQNLEVLQRVNLRSKNPYGLKILEVGSKVLGTKGAVIDITKGGEGGQELFVSLNTDSDAPVNERKRLYKTVNTGTAKPKATKKPKVKAKAKASKPKAKKTTAPADAAPAAEPAETAETAIADTEAATV